MSQHGTFYLGVEISNLWVNGFKSSSTHDLILIAVIVSVVCFLKVALAAILAIFLDRNRRCPLGNRRSRGVRAVCHLLGTLAIIVDYMLGYLLMLVFMIGNIWLCITIILSSTLSYFLTHWSRISLRRNVTAISNRGKEGGINRNDTEETTTLLQKQADSSNPTSSGRGDVVGNAAPLLEASNRQTIVVASPGAPLVSFQNLYDRPTDIAATKGVGTVPPDVISAPVSPMTAGPSSALEREEIKPRSDSNPLLEKYPLLKFHNVDVPDTSPSHHLPQRGLQMQELDKLIHELQS